MSETQLRSLLSACPDGIAAVSSRGELLFANPAAARLLRRTPQEVHGATLGFPFRREGRHELVVAGERAVEIHAVQRHWGGVAVWIVSLFDVTAHKRSTRVARVASSLLRESNAHLDRLASVDPLTGTLNRRGLEAALLVETKRRLRSGAPLAAILLDCDDFKRVNEIYGHTGGDAALKEIAEHLTASVRPCDHLGRVGGDEFLILLPATRYGEAFEVAERLRLSVSERSRHPSRVEFRLTASLGLASLADDVDSLDEVIRRTESFLQNSKRCGKNRLSSQHASASGAEDGERLAIGLLKRGAFRIVPQAIRRLSDEAVAGWELSPRGPAGSFEDPRDFFRLALARNVLAQVDLGCLRACVAHARGATIASRIHVNVFPSTLIETPIEALLEILAPGTAAPPFCVELSEQRFVGDPGLLRERVRALSESGVLVAIDDVGFGCSSLETLILLEPDIVKIDPSFVRRHLADADRSGSLRRMVDVVASLGSELIVEGIDTRGDLAQLQQMGVRSGQGALWDGPSAA